MSLIEGLNECDIYIALDWVTQPEAPVSYLKYIENLRKYAKKNPRIKLSIRDSHGHLSGNIRHCLQYVKSKYIFLLQHDFLHIEPFNMAKIIADMESHPALKHIRFNKRVTECKRIDKDFFGDVVEGEHYQYTQTGGWSDNNHVCLTSYYRDFILQRVPDGTTMERKIYFKEIRDKVAEGTYQHSEYGTYIFGPVGHPKMILHLDGQNEMLMNLSRIERIKFRFVELLKRLLFIKS